MIKKADDCTNIKEFICPTTDTAYNLFFTVCPPCLYLTNTQEDRKKK